MLIATIGKNAREEIRVMLRTSHGRRGIDVRVLRRDGTGAMVETPKGVVIQPDKLQAVIDALAEAGKLTAQEEGAR